MFANTTQSITNYWRSMWMQLVVNAGYDKPAIIICTAKWQAHSHTVLYSQLRRFCEAYTLSLTHICRFLSVRQQYTLQSNSAWSGCGLLSPLPCSVDTKVLFIRLYRSALQRDLIHVNVTIIRSLNNKTQLDCDLIRWWISRSRAYS